MLWIVRYDAVSGGWCPTDWDTNTLKRHPVDDFQTDSDMTLGLVKPGLQGTPICDITHSLQSPWGCFMNPMSWLLSSFSSATMS